MRPRRAPLVSSTRCLSRQPAGFLVWSTPLRPADNSGRDPHKVAPTHMCSLAARPISNESWLNNINTMWSTELIIQAAKRFSTEDSHYARLTQGPTCRYNCILVLSSRISDSFTNMLNGFSCFLLNFIIIFLDNQDLIFTVIPPLGHTSASQQISFRISCIASRWLWSLEAKSLRL